MSFGFTYLSVHLVNLSPARLIRLRGIHRQTTTTRTLFALISHFLSTVNMSPINNRAPSEITRNARCHRPGPSIATVACNCWLETQSSLPVRSIGPFHGTHTRTVSLLARWSGAVTKEWPIIRGQSPRELSSWSSLSAPWGHGEPPT